LINRPDTPPHILPPLLPPLSNRNSFVFICFITKIFIFESSLYVQCILYLFILLDLLHSIFVTVRRLCLSGITQIKFDSKNFMEPCFRQDLRFSNLACIIRRPSSLKISLTKHVFYDIKFFLVLSNKPSTQFLIKNYPFINNR